MARIALLLPDLGAGGAERVTLTLAAEFLARGDAVDVLVLRGEGALIPAVPEGARLVMLGVRRLRNAIRPLRDYAARARPDALLAQMWPLSSIAVWALRRSAIRVAVVEHVDLRASSRRWRLLPRALLVPVLRWSHRRAVARIAVSRGAADALARLCGLPAEAIEAIHNPIPLPRSAPGRQVDWGGGGRRILTVGTLKPQKNHRLLVEAFARMSEPQDRLVILGEGGERVAIKKLAAGLGMADRVLLPGFALDPGPWYASADLFVLSSDYEGFANVVAEALGHGLRVVSTDCPSGPAEILGGIGRLVPVGDVGALAEAMTAALAAPADPAAARARAAAFAPPAIADRYRRLLLGYRP